MEMIGIVPVIIGLTQVVKLAGLPSRYAPLFAVLLGVCISTAVSPVTGMNVLLGIVYGLTASGLYSGTKAVSGK